MGNGLFSCKGCNEYCFGRAKHEINNNLYNNSSDMKLDDKSKSEQRIITNIFNPNYKFELSGENSNINQKENFQNIHNNSLKNVKIKKENNFDNSLKEEEEPPNNFTQYVNDANKNERSLANSPLLTITTSVYNQSNNRNIFNNYNIEMINFLNKLRKTPKLVINDIDDIIKNNIKKIDDKEYIITDNTNEMIKLNINMEKIKEYLNEQESVEILKLNNKLKINHYYYNTEVNEKIVNELVLSKKRELIKEYPKCYFYPIFIKNIKINYILLLENSKIRKKIFDKNFIHFYATTFNEKSNRFFAILCFA